MPRPKSLDGLVECFDVGDRSWLVNRRRAQIHGCENGELVGPIASLTVDLEQVHADGLGRLLGRDETGTWWEWASDRPGWLQIFE